MCSLSEDRAAALDAARLLVTQYLGQQPHIMKASGVPAELLEDIGKVLTWPATHDQVVAASKLVPDEVVQMITASGTAEECRAKVAEYVEHGCTCPILYPLGTTGPRWTPSRRYLPPRERPLHDPPADLLREPLRTRARLQPRGVVGDRVVVSGTAAQRPDGTVDADAGDQARRCLEIITGALAEAGASPADVVRTRVFLVDAADFDAVAAAHGEVFGDIRPANSTVVVAALLNPAWKVEIEVEAVIGPPPLEPVPEDWSRALAIVAHPDDLEYGTASAVARWTRQGKEVRYLLATRGEAGIDGMDPAEAGPLREAEERAGAAQVGVSVVDFLERTDGVVPNDVDLRRDLCRAIRAFRPEVLLTISFDLTWAGGHLNMADHRNVGLAVLDAARDAGNRWIFPELADEGVEPWDGVRVVLVGGSARPTHAVDVGDTLDAGVASLRAHAAYLAGLAKGTVGTDPEPFLRGSAEATGARFGGRPAAAFEAVWI